MNNPSGYAQKPIISIIMVIKLVIKINWRMLTVNKQESLLCDLIKHPSLSCTFFSSFMIKSHLIMKPTVSFSGSISYCRHIHFLCEVCSLWAWRSPEILVRKCKTVSCQDWWVWANLYIFFFFFQGIVTLVLKYIHTSVSQEGIHFSNIFNYT